MKRTRKSRAGLTVLDLLLAVLIIAAVLSTVFDVQIRSFLKEEKNVQITYVFQVKNASESTLSYPGVDEKLVEMDSGAVLGTLTSIWENQSDSAGADQSKTLTCKATTDAVNDGGTYLVSGLKIKSGESYKVDTDTASFVMTIVKVEETTEE